MLRPLIQRLTLTAILLGALLGAGAVVDITAGSGELLAASESAAPIPHERAPANDAATAAQTARQVRTPAGPNRRWPFFSFGAAKGKRSW